MSGGASLDMQTSVSSRVLHLPPTGQELPTPADLDRVAALPLYQLFVVGRSGSGLVHAYLDGHPQVLHVPHIFKFFDFAVAHPGIADAPPDQIVDAFTAWENVQDLFDSTKSVIVGGRLGPDMATAVLIDKNAFRRSFLASAGTRQVLGLPLAFRNLVLAFGWCAGQPVAQARVVFQHLHHGDWLWPERLIERYNAQDTPPQKLLDALRATGYLLSVRDPGEAAASVWNYVDQRPFGELEAIEAKELYFRLLLQDWDRLAWVTDRGLNARVIRLEDLRRDARGVMAGCARWMGIDDGHSSLGDLTYHGLDWYGDIFTKPSKTVHQSGRPGLLAWQDRAVLHSVIAKRSKTWGYGRAGAKAWALAKLGILLAAISPSPTLLPKSGSWFARYRYAVRHAAARVRFVAALRRLPAALP
jgi:hypothetical protein